MAEGIEIERKFLVSEVPGDLASHPSESIEQGYIVVEGSAEVRVRRRGRPAWSGQGAAGVGPGSAETGPGSAETGRDAPKPRRTELTIKSGGGRVRVEEEFEIDERRSASLWPLSEGRRVSKTRYRLPGGGGLTIEVDVYTGDLSGLVTAEVEFHSEAASDEFEPPEWFGRELTEDHRYSNRSLAVDGRPTP
ncbi:MAG: adenylate cyclase [Solirubrobacteraceae bacterium]|jgi:CYTH domain-containing protein|nr:adenylate cyclase [Solirubrobacteraceae bacterium]